MTSPMRRQAPSEILTRDEESRCQVKADVTNDICLAAEMIGSGIAKGGNFVTDAIAYRTVLGRGPEEETGLMSNQFTANLQLPNNQLEGQSS